MTGLYNRRGLFMAADKLTSRAQPGSLVAAAVVDVDRFKTLNESQGHERGDEALRTLAEALDAVTRPGDIAARVGGDEFVVIALTGSEADVSGFTDRLGAALSSAAETVTASVGVAWLPLQAGAIDAVLRHADQGMYQAKQQGGNRIVQVGHAAN